MINLDREDGKHLIDFLSVFNKLFDCQMMSILVMTGTGDGHFLQSIADISTNPDGWNEYL